MFDVIILAIALSMDAFAVSIGLGSKRIKSTGALALLAGGYFGLFQGIMPLMGYMAGRGVLDWIEFFAPWVAFILLLLIGAKMIYEAFSEGIEENFAVITQRVMLLLAIATSIDAMAAGFSLTLLNVNPLLACLIIGVITLIFSVLGVFIGAKMGTWLENKAAFLGGIVLIVMGFKILLM